MELRLCEKLNKIFIPHKPAETLYTHQVARTWNTIEKLFISLVKDLTEPRQIWVSFDYTESIPIITLSNFERIETDLTLQSVKDVIPKARNQGLKVEVDPEFKEITFIFTPSNY